MPLYQTIILVTGIGLVASVWIFIGLVRLSNKANRHHEKEVNAEQREGRLDPKVWNNHLMLREQRIRRMNKLNKFFTPYFFIGNFGGGALILFWVIFRVVASFYS